LVTAAVTVLPSVGTLAVGLVPQRPDQVDYGEVPLWLGFALSGAVGLMWYLSWLTAKGYGAGGRQGKEKAPLDGLVTLVPLALFLIVGQPVGLLKLSGAIEAAHIPFVTGLTLYPN
jgi:hypothetical protein